LRVADAKGGVKACLEDDEALKELISISKKQDSKSSPGFPGTQGDPFNVKTDGTDMSLVTLKKELKEDFDQALEKNMVTFERKLEMQKRQIMVEVEGVVKREGDRVISYFFSGPHDRILDPVSQIPSNLNLRIILTISGPARALG
jgi:hypothetical protein